MKPIKDRGPGDYLITCRAPRCSKLVYIDENVNSMCRECFQNRSNPEHSRILESLLIASGMYIRPPGERPPRNHRPTRAVQSRGLFDEI